VPVDLEVVQEGGDHLGRPPGPWGALAALDAVTKAERQLAETPRVCDLCSINFHPQAGTVCAQAADLPRACRHLAAAERVSGLWPGDPWSAAAWETRAALRLA
jgi:hypothetical protein